MTRIFFALAILLLTASQSWAAISANTVWEVRTTGADTNGGGFVPGSGGTDYSQQDAAQVSVTDGVAAGTTTITSATATFTTAMIGNLIYVQGGTGSITAGWYEIMTYVSATEITVDRSTGLTAGTGVTLKIGGALASLTQTALNIADGNTAYVKATADYTKTSTTTWAVQGTGLNGGIRIIGYTSARGDGGQATVTSATNSIILFTLNNADYYTFENLKFTHTAATKGAAVANTTNNSMGTAWRNCEFDGCSEGIGEDTSNAISYTTIDGCVFRNCSNASRGAIVAEGTTYISDTLFANNVGPAIYSSSAMVLSCERCVFDTNPYDIRSTNAGQTITVDVRGCAHFGATTDAIDIAATSGLMVLRVVDSIFYGVTGEGIDNNDTSSRVTLWNNAFGGNGTNYSGINTPDITGSVTLAGSPFTNAAADDFTLKGSDANGLLCMDAGLGAFDLGAFQGAEDYPAEADVELAVDYFFGTLTGTLDTTPTILAARKSQVEFRSIAQSTAAKVRVYLVDADDGTAFTGATLTVNLAKSSESVFTDITGATTEAEIGSGWYEVTFTTTHTNALGAFTLHITATGADPADGTCQVDPGVTVTGGLVSADVAAINSDTTADNNLAEAFNGDATGGHFAASEFIVTEGVAVATSDTNESAFAATGNGTGAGMSLTGGASAGTGLLATGGATNATGAKFSGTGTGDGFDAIGGSGVTSTGAAFISLASTTGIGFAATGSGTGEGHGAQLVGTPAGTGEGLKATGGGTGTGVTIAGGDTSGNALTLNTTSGHGVFIQPLGTNKHGINVTGGNVGTSDAIKLTAGAGGVQFRSDITGTVDTVTTLTNLPAITSNWLTAAGTAADFSTEVAAEILAGADDFGAAMDAQGYTSTVAGRIDAAITTRLAPTVSGRTLDVTSTGAAGIDFANVENPTTTVGLSGTTIAGSTTIGTPGVGAFWNVPVDDIDNTPTSIGTRLGDNVDAQISAAGGNSNVLLSTTAASGSGTSYVLAAGSDVNDTYNEQTIVFYDASNSDFPSVGVVTDYVGSTKTVTIETAPVFTVAASDPVKVFVGSSFGSGTALTAQETRDALKLAPTAGAGAAGSIDARLPDTLDTGLMRSNAALSAGQIQDIADDLVAAGVGVNITPVNQEPIPPSRIWRVKATNAGLRYENTLSVQDGGVAKLFAVDFSQDLPNNGRVTDINSVAIQSGTAGGVTFGADLADVDDYGVDRSLAKFNITPVTAGTYIIRVSVDYDDGSVSVADVKLVVVD